MHCPKCGHKNPRGVEVCQGCRKVRFVRKPKAGAEPDAETRTGPKAVGESEPRVAPDAPTKRLSRTPLGVPDLKMAPAIPKTRVIAKAGSNPATKPDTRTASRPRKHLLVRVGAPPIEIDPSRLPFTFGRGETCSLPIPSARVSRVHAEIRAQDGKLVLVDLGSANGTSVGGKPIKEHRLVHGDEIEIGPFLCVYQRGDPAGMEKAAPPPSLGAATLVDPAELLGGQIKGEGLTEVLQGIDFNKKTGTLVVFSSEVQGWLTVRDGVPQAAATGKVSDLEAVFALLALKDGRFSFTEELRTEERTLKTTVTGLLLEWGRRADENAARDARRR